MKKYCTEKSKALYEENRKYVTDGVGSYFHRAKYQEYPIAITCGKVPGYTMLMGMSTSIMWQDLARCC